MKKVILFDGECNFCDQSVQFIMKRDPKGYFTFASLQSNIGKQLLHLHNAPDNLNSFVLIEDDKCYFQSTAALRVCKYLTGAWKVAYILILVPKPIRDVVYRYVAKNRYRWFGTKTSCPIPSPADRKRFLH